MPTHHPADGILISFTSAMSNINTINNPHTVGNFSRTIFVHKFYSYYIWTK